MKRIILLLLVFCSSTALAQGPAVSLGGSAGITGSLSLTGQTNLILSTDANRTLIPSEWWAGTIKTTSTVSLTATRSVILPANPGQKYTVENLTTGGQSVIYIATSGTGVTVANGASAAITFDGTNYLNSTGSGGGFITSITTTGTTGASTVVSGVLNIPIYSGGGSGFPITLGSTSIASGSTTTSISGLTVNGVALNNTGANTLYLDKTGAYSTPSGTGSGVSSISFSPPLYASGSTGAVTANCSACAFYNIGLPTSTLPLHSTASTAIVVAAAIGLATTDVSGVLPAAEMTPLGASGGSHSAGIAPDPGATAGTTRFLREDSTWAVPAGGGGGTVNSFAAPSGSWPTWLVPTVTNSTTTPSLAVAASAIPATAIAGSGITTINSYPCTIGSSCTVSAAPAVEIRAYQLAVTSGGVAYFNGATPYSTQQPQAGAVAPATSSLGYVAFNAAATNPQYLELTIQPPTYWTASDVAISFFAPATTGNVTWEIQTACPQFNVAPGAPTFSSVQPITTAVSTTTNGLVSTAILTNIAAPGTNGCTAGTTTLGTPLTIRLFRANGGTDTAASDADALTLVLLTHRSQ
jgi:hypothetical protein